jgi:hypothetical protein
MCLERSEANDFVASFFLSGGTGGWCGGFGGEKCVLVISSYFRSLGRYGCSTFRKHRRRRKGRSDHYDGLSQGMGGFGEAFRANC